MPTGSSSEPKANDVFLCNGMWSSFLNGLAVRCSQVVVIVKTLLVLLVLLLASPYVAPDFEMWYV